MNEDGPPPLRIVGLIGPPRFITREQFAARNGTRGEVTRDMDYSRRAQSMRMTQADGENTDADATEDPAKGEDNKGE
jgi:hypothetical protein